MPRQLNLQREPPALSLGCWLGHQASVGLLKKISLQQRVAIGDFFNITVYRTLKVMPATVGTFGSLLVEGVASHNKPATASAVV
jgi:hypothetical protein